ncbi:hypothetical protein TthTF19_12470 [Thermus thermophilus]|uniref:hypothetical protein n=1 Tax=Thermus thermophilus TaxID=274 RepID=UPI0030E2733A
MVPASLRHALRATGLALLVFVLFLFLPFAATPRPDTRAVLLLLHVPPVAAYLWGLWRMEGEIRP